MENISPYIMMHNFVQSNKIEKFVQKKNGFDYLPWSIAYHYAKTVFPTCKIIKHTFKAESPNDTILPVMLDAQGYAYVQCSVIWGEYETTEIFPVTDYKNQAVKNPTSKDVDNALQRCKTKCIAMFCGLGLQLWHGEDLPVSSDSDSSEGKDGEGAASSISAQLDGKNPTEDVAPPSNFQPLSEVLKKPELTLDEKLENCSDLDSLTELYHEQGLGMTPDVRKLFTKRKQELLDK
jgi:hypothetical protein